MTVNEPAILKKLVHGEREPAAHTEHATEKVRPWTQMRDFAQKFRRVPLFLEWITFVGTTDNLDISRDEFPFLSFALRPDQRAIHNNGSASVEPLDLGVIRQRILLCDDLKIAQRRAVVQFDKRKVLRITSCAHPSLHTNGLNRRCALQCIFNRSWRKLRHAKEPNFNAQRSTLNAQRSSHANAWAAMDCPARATRSTRRQPVGRLRRGLHAIETEVGVFL